MVATRRAVSFVCALTVWNGLAQDDASCKWSFDSWRCEPAASCAFQFRGGDLTLDENCRLRKELYSSPQQIHCAYAGESVGTGMTVSWATMHVVNDSSVWLGDSPDKLVLQNEVHVAPRSYYADDDYSLFEYHATLLGLKPFTKYFYKVGSANQTDYQSGVASFTTARLPPQANDDETITIAVYGDNGRGSEAQSTLSLLNSLADDIDMVLHLGDISYADDAFLTPSEFIGFFYEEAWNQWFNALSPLMSKVPYMVLVGNHEAECHSPSCQLSARQGRQLGNYTAYNHRFKMPSQESGGVLNMWYSFDHGPIHFTCISSETDYPGAPDNSFLLAGGASSHPNGNFGDQLTWLEQDLIKANAQRHLVPWLVVGLHRPLYSINECDANGTPTDQALVIQQTFEQLLVKYKVDVVVAGHHHWYERHFPINDNHPIKTGVSSDHTLYATPQAPVHLVSGAGGNVEGFEKLQSPNKSFTTPWNVVHIEKQFGIHKLQVNGSAMTWMFVASENEKVLDAFTITKK